jgi:hypothetical protein
MNGLLGVVDACNLIDPSSLNGLAGRYTGIGRGRSSPDSELTDYVVESFRMMERGVANELEELIDFLNAEYAPDDFNRSSLAEVRRLARTCTTGCDIAEAGAIDELPEYRGFRSRLARVAAGS